MYGASLPPLPRTHDESVLSKRAQLIAYILGTHSDEKRARDDLVKKRFRSGLVPRLATPNIDGDVHPRLIRATNQIETVQHGLPLHEPLNVPIVWSVARFISLEPKQALPLAL